MKQMMSLSARREMLISIRQRYLESSWTEKGRILDGFIATTGYDRKYAISLLHQKARATDSVQAKARPGAQVYDEQFRQVLLYIWYTANQVCSKRLVPFLPDLVAAMERHGHLRVTADIRDKLVNLLKPKTAEYLGGQQAAIALCGEGWVGSLTPNTLDNGIGLYWVVLGSKVHDS